MSKSVKFKALIFLVDKCLKCHKDAECVEGVCKCKEGFIGNGYNCIVEITTKPGMCWYNNDDTVGPLLIGNLWDPRLGVIT